MIKYCIWDVGNTIYPYSIRDLHRWAQGSTLDLFAYKRSGTVLSYDFKPYMKGEESTQQFAENLCEIYRIPFNKTTIPEINKALHKGVGKYFPETLEAMEFLRDEGVQNGLLSNALPLLGDTVDIIEPEFSFPSYELGKLKPDLKIYQDVKERLDCEYREILFIDDKPKNVEAAKELGIHALVYRQDSVVNDVKNIISENNYKKIRMPGYTIVR